MIDHIKKVLENEEFKRSQTLCRKALLKKLKFVMSSDHPLQQHIIKLINDCLLLCHKLHPHLTANCLCQEKRAQQSKSHGCRENARQPKLHGNVQIFCLSNSADNQEYMDFATELVTKKHELLTKLDQHVHIDFGCPHDSGRQKWQDLWKLKNMIKQYFNVQPLTVSCGYFCQ